LRAIIPKSQDKVELLDRFASIHNDIGAAYIRKDEQLEAMSYYAAALKLQRQLVEENPKHARVSEFRYELANQLNRMGELNSNIGVVTEAAKLHGEALAILKDLAGTTPKGSLATDIQRALATSHEQIGHVDELNNQTPKALAAYQLALPIRERLATANPMVTDYQSELANTYFTLGTLNARAGKWPSAAELYQRAIDRQHLVIAAAPEESEPARLLARQLAALGSAQRQLDQRADALRSYQEARAVLEKINKPDGSDLVDLARALAACSLLIGPAKGEPSPAEKSQKEKDVQLALEALRQAVAGGYRGIERLEKDAEFESLRSQKEFQSLVADLRKKIRVLDWHSDIEAAKAQAAREKKDVFVYFTGSDWCPWCLLVRREVLGKDAFIDYAPKHFVLVELDFPRHKPKPKEFEQNQALLEKWALEGFPSLILADAQGRPYASLRDGNVRDESTAYVELMEKLRKNRVARDELLAQSLAAEGLKKAQALDKALELVPRSFLAGAYPDIVSQILSLDPEDKAGLRSKYLPTILSKRRIDVQEAMKKQDWDGTILKIDKIIAELKPTGKLAAEVWIDRARAHAKLSHWDQAEADYAQALKQKPDDPDLLIERGQFFQNRGQSDRALKDFVAAIDLQAKVVEARRPVFEQAPDGRNNRLDLSQAYLKLGEVQRHAGRLSDAAATALERAKLWPDFFNETYNVACELALCASQLGKGGELTAEQRAQRQQYTDQAMEWLRKSVLQGYADPRHMKEDTDLDALRDRDDYKAVERALEGSDQFTSVALHSRGMKGHTKPLIECVAVSPNGRLILSSGYDETVRLWDTETGREVRQLQGHKGMVHKVAFGDAGRRAVTAGADGTVRVWDTETGQQLRKLEGHEGPVLGVAISADGKQVLSGGQDKTLRLWDVDAGKEVRKLEGHKDAVLALALSADGRRAVSGGKTVMYYWDVESGKTIHRLEVPGDSVASIALSADGRRAIGGSGLGFAYLWDLEKDKLIHRLAGHWNLVRGVGFTPDGRQVVAGNIATGLIVSDVETGRDLYRLGVGLPCGGLAVASNGRSVVSANNDGMVHIWTLSPDAVRARNLAQTGHAAEAEAAYAKLVQDRPDDGDLRLERARFYAREHKWQQAIADYDRAIEIGPADPDTRLERGRCQAKLGQWEQAAADYDAALAALDTDPNGLARHVKVCEEVVRQPQLFDRLSTSRPKDAQLHLARGRMLARTGQWAEAATEVARSVELLPPADAETWFEHASLRLLVGDPEGYRVACSRLLEAFDKKDSKLSGYLVGRAGTLAPNAVPDLKALETAADKELNGNQRIYWSLVERAALHYRAGRYDQALTLLRECLLNHPKWNGQGLSWLWLAMAQHKLGQSNDARESLSKADEWFANNGKEMPVGPPGTAPMTLQDWLEAHVIQREAKALISGPANHMP
jgi:WD40 repeat protein/thioredoxin-related protein